jgi:hypothetical protein
MRCSKCGSGIGTGLTLACESVRYPSTPFAVLSALRMTGGTLDYSKLIAIIREALPGVNA